MTQDEFDDLIQEIREEDPEQLDSEFFVRDKPLKEDKVAKLEQKAGFALPEEYRNFLKRFGAGDIGTITVLSLDPESDFSLWKNQEPFEKVSWIPVVDDGKSNFYGLVQSKDGLVHKVQPGNYLGQNDGKVTDITASKISLVEIIPDGLGGYIERPASLALND